MVWVVRGLNVLSGPTMLAWILVGSPAPDGPSALYVYCSPRFANTSKGKAERHVTIGKTLQPLVRRLGPEFHMRSKGMSHPPLKVKRGRMSLSLEARNRLG